MHSSGWSPWRRRQRPTRLEYFRWAQNSPVVSQPCHVVLYFEMVGCGAIIDDDDSLVRPCMTFFGVDTGWNMFRMQ